jgi:hypothetical protein
MAKTQISDYGIRTGLILVIVVIIGLLFNKPIITANAAGAGYWHTSGNKILDAHKLWK